MNIYERMEEIIRDGEISIKGEVLYRFFFDWNGFEDYYYWKLDKGLETEEFYTMEELKEYINTNWIKEGE